MITILTTRERQSETHYNINNHDKIYRQVHKLVRNHQNYAFIIRISFSEVYNRKSTQRSTLLFSQQYVLERFMKTNEI